MRNEPNVRVQPAGMHVPAVLTGIAGYVEARPRAAVWALCSLLLLGVIVADALTGPQVAFALFYLLPVGMAAWHLGWRPALLAVAVGGIACLLVDGLAVGGGRLAAVEYWNAAVRAALLFVVAYTLTCLKQALTAERALARTDALTGLSNNRSFMDLGEREMSRARRLRSPVTLAFLDVDDFKRVNDSHGHAAGDELLAEIARTLEAETRAADVVARLGGDEFGMLLPDTPSDGARVVIERILIRLEDACARGGWLVGFSVGVVTIDHPSVTLTGLLRQADHAMYEAKRAGGGHALYRDETQPAQVDRRRRQGGMH